MAITAAAIEANGWVLALTMTGTRSASAIAPTANGTSDDANFAAYALTPNTTPAMTLALTAKGFVQSAGVVVPSAAVARALVATKVLRRPVVSTPAGVRNDKTPDETDLGGGSFKVRIALSEHVYFGESGLTLTFAAGWRTGEGAGTIAVTNGSRIGSGDATMPPLPSPIVRWADVPYQRLVSTTLIPLEVVAFSHHPNGLAPIAGVRFTVTDGTNTATAWATALSSSPKYATGGSGVATRVYRVVVDGSTATPAALTEGLIRCDFKAFPWIGQARSSNTLDTTLAVVASSTAPSMTNLGTAGMAPAAQVPFVYAYDPNNTWTPTLYVYVEPNTFAGIGSVTSNVLTITSVTSGALAAGTKVSASNTAFNANLITPGTTIVAQLSGTTGGVGTYSVTATPNFAAASAYDVRGGGTFVNGILTFSANPATAAAGVCAQAIDVARNGMVTQARTTAARNGQAAIGPKATDGIVIRIKAGTYANPGGTAGVSSGIAGCYSWEIIEGDPADSNPRANVILNTAASTLRLNRVAVRNLFLNGPTGAVSAFPATYAWADNVEINGNGVVNNTASPFAGATNAFLTNVKYWRINTYLSGQLVRNCQVENQIVAIAALNNARLSTAGVGSAGIGAPGSAVDPLGATQDIVVAGNDLRYISGARAWACGVTPAANAGSTALGTTGYAVFNRQVFANNVCETYGTSQPMFNAIGENGATVATYSIVEGNTLTGDRTNWLYDDLNLATIAANDTESNIMLGNRVANNSFDWQPSKHDSFADDVVRAQRIGVALASFRTTAFAVGAEVVVAGSPTNVYRCSQAGTTASTGGPTGTGTGIVDGTAKWDWFATETRQHGYRPQAVRGWSSHYGVGYVDNITLSASGSATEFDHEFEGLGAKNFVRETGSAGDPKWTLNKGGTTTSANYSAVNTGGGNYKPLAGSPLIGRGRAANIDVDRAGVLRALPFAAGAVQNDTAISLVPAGALQATRAASPVVALALVIVPRGSVVATRAASPAAALTLAVAPRGSVVATRAASPVVALGLTVVPRGSVVATRVAVAGVGWTTVLAAASTAIATRAAASTTRWTTTLGAASARLATRAAATMAAWTTALLPDPGRAASRASDGRIDWATVLAAANARSMTSAAAGAVVVVAPAGLAPADGRIRVVDRTLPTLLPGSVTPPERTLIVTGDFRTATIPAD